MRRWKMEIKVKIVGNYAKIPQYQKPGDSGMDLHACLPDSDTYTVIKPWGSLIVPTGLSFSIPEGYEGQVRSRSGMASRGIVVANSPGTVDSGYRGEVKVILQNLRGMDAVISHNERIAQFVIAPVVKAKLKVVNDLDATERGTGGFGSTGG
jgi:dUTP pyrophosphatase